MVKDNFCGALDVGTLGGWVAEWNRYRNAFAPELAGLIFCSDHLGSLPESKCPSYESIGELSIAGST
jgi:hypothetical protein